MLLYRLCALAAGLTLAFQPPMNARLRSVTGDPIVAALISLAVSILVLFLIALCIGRPHLAFTGALGAPWYVWTGGILGAISILSSIIVVPRLGTAQMLSIAVFGMMIGGLSIDQFGWFGLEVRPLSFPRFVGAGLLVAGVVCVTRA
jgi:transporter family-2 protein